MSAVADAAVPGRGEPGGVCHILVVDDTPDIRLLLRLALDGDGRFQVVGEAGDGVEAIDAAGRLHPDVVLLDLAMPVMDGLEALPGIRSASPESKIIVLSGFNAREMSAEALKLGASSYMEKGDIANLLIPHILRIVDRPPEAPAEPALGAAVPEPTAARPFTAATGHDLSDEWVSVLAHELNNPVAVLQGFARVLHSAVESMSPKAIKDSAGAIDRAVTHLGSLVQAFSDLRRIEVDTFDLVLEATDISELVRETVTDMGQITATHPVILELADGALASVDPPRIRQILINLLANAAKFTPANTSIEISVSTVADRVEVSVRDHGPGIATSDLSAMFRKFSRLDPNVAGTGIGLFLSRGIARAHGGDLVLADSNAPGCRFVLRMPALGSDRSVTPPNSHGD